MPTTPAGLHVPVSREERLRAIDALTEKMETGEAGGEALERELRQIDDRIRVVRIAERAGELHPRQRAPGVIPGRWHVKLLSYPRNAYFALCGPDWAYSEPDLHWVEKFKEADLWRDGALEEIRKGEDEDERARARAVLLEGEQRRDQIAADWRALKRVRGDGGLDRRTDRGNAPHVSYAGGVSFAKASDSGLLLPTGG
jgi:hypothetical protein